MSWTEKLEKLRKELATGKNFGQIWDYFFDHFGENDAFMRLPKPGWLAAPEDCRTQLVFLG
jgi:hypothetical protein